MAEEFSETRSEHRGSKFGAFLKAHGVIVGAVMLGSALAYYLYTRYMSGGGTPSAVVPSSIPATSGGGSASGSATSSGVSAKIQSALAPLTAKLTQAEAVAADALANSQAQAQKLAQSQAQSAGVLAGLDAQLQKLQTAMQSTATQTSAQQSALQTEILHVQQDLARVGSAVGTTSPAIGTATTQPTQVAPSPITTNEQAYLQNEIARGYATGNLGLVHWAQKYRAQTIGRNNDVGAGGTRRYL